MNVVPAGLAREDPGYSKCWKVFCEALPGMGAAWDQRWCQAALTTERSPSRFCK